MLGSSPDSNEVVNRSCGCSIHSPRGHYMGTSHSHVL